MYLDTACQPSPGTTGVAPPKYRQGTIPLPAVNAGIVRLWAAGLRPRPVLDAEHLVARAMRRMQLTDFGKGRHWRPLLDCLVAALQDADLSPLGEVVAESQLTGALAARLRARAILKANPEIVAIPITAPIVIVGQMRSGTTRLQRLLAADPRLDHTRLYESRLPVGIDRPTPFDFRRAHVAIWLAATRALNPDFDVIHPTVATAPDEEAGLLGLTLCSSQYEIQWRVPAYARACEALDRTPIYAEFKTLLQITRWLRGCDTAADRPWVLKVPQFSQDLAALLAVFPDARLLCLDRDGATTLASSTSLVHNQMAMQANSVDPQWIGREWLHKIALRDRVRRDVLSAGATSHLVIDYDAMGRDWLAEMQRVYNFIGIELTPAVVDRMSAFLTSSAQRHAHRYELQQFGLNPDGVRRRLAST
ncbi:sulfotransferase family protein [Sandarakinorhabdus sp. DWP1-3-1]|uniref:sulfotransferase family protein n=1 Tax=Sandarakinorhabdus sp. DWP1-3-1 TaxID=2804627 RepID=UPI003CF11DC8